MLSALRTIRSPSRRVISDAFVSLSGQDFKPLTPTYADLKARLIRGHESEVRESWERLLRHLREEIPLIVELGSKVIPEIDFKDIDNAPEAFSNELRKRGVAVVRGVVPEQEALLWKDDLREYIRQNPQTKGRFHMCRDEITTEYIQPFQPTTLKSSNCTGPEPSSSRAETRTSSRRIDSSCRTGTASTHTSHCPRSIP
jgi:hypothetical protein